jgi:hypothetical protein
VPIANTTGLLRRPGTLWRTPQVLNPAPDPVLRAPVFTPQRISLAVGGVFLAVNLLTSTLSAPAEAAPFIPEDFGPSQRQVGRPANDAQQNLLLSTLAAPERDVYLWPNRTIGQPVPGSWSSSTLPLLRTDPLPFAFEDWQGQASARTPSRWDAPNLLTSTLAAPPIRVTDWSGTRSVTRAYGFEPQNLLLTTLAPAAPVVLPFAQYDWPAPKVAARRYTFDAPNPTLTTLTLTVQPAPFTPYDWSVRKTPANQDGAWSSSTLPLFATVLDVLPFAQYDWKLPYQRGPVQDFTIAVPVVLQDVPPPVVESERPYPQPAGKSRGRPLKQRRYELPNGMHVFGTANQVLALAQSLVDEPVVLRRSKPIYKITVQLADGTKAQAKAVFPVERMGKMAGPVADATQVAPSRDIHFDAVVALLAQRALRRRKISMLLLMS